MHVILCMGIYSNALFFCLQTPMKWLSKWDGPEDPMLYLRGLVARAIAIQTWVDKGPSILQETLDLAELFHPDTFLNAFKQQTARYVTCLKYT